MKRVLIIDDAEFARMVLREMLKEKGYEVCGEAADGEEGVEKFKRLRPDVTLCDIRMHKMSGFDCIRLIMEEDPNARVIVCASIDSDEKLDHVWKLGVKGVLNKPVHIDELTALLEKALSEKSAPKSYKELMEERAEAEGIGLNSRLDYYMAFKSLSGFDLDDPKADKEFLCQNGAGIMIGMRALVSAKIPLEQLNKLEKIFEELIL